MRIAACQPGEVANAALVPTWVTEGVNSVDSITYPLFNKAWAIAAYMKHARPQEECVLVLDSDMLLHRPFLPSEFGIAPGRAASENMWYLEVRVRLMCSVTVPAAWTAAQVTFFAGLSARIWCRT